MFYIMLDITFKSSQMKSFIFIEVFKKGCEIGGGEGQKQQPHDDLEGKADDEDTFPVLRNPRLSIQDHGEDVVVQFVFECLADNLESPPLVVVREVADLHAEGA